MIFKLELHVDGEFAGVGRDLRAFLRFAMSLKASSGTVQYASTLMTPGPSSVCIQTFECLSAIVFGESVLEDQCS